jgi:hypothetical protein
MAQRRMFNLKIVDTDAFLDMPQSTQNLYFHLGMRADDEGFIGNVKRTMKMIGSSEDDLRVLISKKFILTFESGVVVIKHWKMNNYLQNDRLQKTTYTQEKSQLNIKDNKSYTLDKSQGKPVVEQMYTKCIHSIVENSIVENSIVENSIDNNMSAKNADDNIIKSFSKNNNAIDVNLEEKFNLFYEVYPSVRRDGKTKAMKNYNSWIKGKSITTLQMKKNIKLNHIQIYLATKRYVEDFKKSNVDDVTGEIDYKYMKLLSTFMNNILEYVENTESVYEKAMEKQYGEDWKKVKFNYE